MKKKKEHLPVYGVGPIYGICIILSTVIGIILSCMEVIPAGRFAGLRIPFIIIGILIVILGFGVWYKAAFRIDKYIVSNRLCMDGIYAVVRNPCYSGIMLMCTGAIFMVNTPCLFLLPLVYWLAMTILMKNTEEKWLYELYGEEYLDYCKRVNRCIPWFQRKKYGADLTRADFRDAEIEGANGDDCNMERKKRKGVKLIQFDLDDPNVIEMLAEEDLEYADWTGIDDAKRRMLMKDWS